MRTAQPHYHFVAKLPERSNNHPNAWLVVVFDERASLYFACNTCDVHERKAPWDGGRASPYDSGEIVERLTMMKAGGLL